MSEPVSVEAVFEADGRIRPMAFIWRGERRSVAAMGRHWVEGERRHYLVMDRDERVFELVFSPGECAWRGVERSSAGTVV